MNIQPVILEGPRIRLEPLSLVHRAPLCAVGLNPALWRSTTIRVQTPVEMGEYILAALDARETGTAMPFVMVSRQTDRVIGTTRYHSVVPAHRRLEIGFTWVGLPWQRTAINTESKYLLLAHAFERLGCQRVEFKADSENEPSCRALRSIGATQEGILRSYMRSAHTGARDVALFSIVSAEWPSVKAHLQRKLSTIWPADLA